jgi:hypothetical protein
MNTIKTGNFGKTIMKVLSRGMGVVLLCAFVVVTSTLGSGCDGDGAPDLPDKMPRDFGFAAFSKTDVVWYLEVAAESGDSWKAKYMYAGGYAEFVGGKGVERVFVMPHDQVQGVYDRLRQIKFLQFPVEPLPPPPEPSDPDAVEALHAFMLQVTYGQAGIDRVEHEVHWWDTNETDGTVRSLRETLVYIESLVEVSKGQTNP